MLEDGCISTSVIYFPSPCDVLSVRLDWQVFVVWHRKCIHCHIDPVQTCADMWLHSSRVVSCQHKCEHTQDQLMMCLRCDHSDHIQWWFEPHASTSLLQCEYKCILVTLKDISCHSLISPTTVLLWSKNIIINLQLCFIERAVHGAVISTAPPALSLSLSHYLSFPLTYTYTLHRLKATTYTCLFAYKTGEVSADNMWSSGSLRQTVETVSRYFAIWLKRNSENRERHACLLFLMCLDKLGGIYE